MAKKTVTELITAHLRARELGRRHYAKADRLLDEIMKALPVGQEVELAGEKKAKIKDNYPPGINKVFRSHGISRYELEVKP